MRTIQQLLNSYTALQRKGLALLLVLMVALLGVKAWLHFQQPEFPQVVGATEFERELMTFEADTLIELNRATYDELLNLPDIGPSYAQKILDHRLALGGFFFVHQLTDIKGIGPAKFEKMAVYARVDTFLVIKVQLDSLTVHPYLDSLSALKLQTLSGEKRLKFLQQKAAIAKGNDSLLLRYVRW